MANRIMESRTSAETRADAMSGGEAPNATALRANGSELLPGTFWSVVAVCVALSASPDARAETGYTHARLWVQGVNLLAREYPSFSAFLAELQMNSPFIAESTGYGDPDSVVPRSVYAQVNCMTYDEDGDCTAWYEEGLPRHSSGSDHTMWFDGATILYDRPNTTLRYIGQEAQWVDQYRDISFHIHALKRYPAIGDLFALADSGTEWGEWMEEVQGQRLTALDHFYGGYGGRLYPYADRNSRFDRYDIDCTDSADIVALALCLVEQSGIDGLVTVLGAATLFCGSAGGVPEPSCVVASFFSVATLALLAGPSRHELTTDEFVAWALEAFDAGVTYCTGADGCQPSYALDQYVNETEREELGILHDPDFDGERDLGTDAVDQKSIPARLPYSFFLGKYLEPGTWGTGMIRALGPAAHYLADASVPQHAAGTLGNYHAYTENVVEDGWRYLYPANVGTSCAAVSSGASELDRVRCLVEETRALLLAVHIYSGEYDCPTAGWRAGLCKAQVLYELVHQQARDDFEPLVDDLDEVNAAMAARLCATGAGTSASGQGRSYMLRCAGRFGGEEVLFRGNPTGNLLLFPDDALRRRGLAADVTPRELDAVWASWEMEANAEVRRAIRRETDRDVAASVALLFLMAGSEGGVGVPDVDRDFIPDAIDECPMFQPSVLDTDGDGALDECDNCPRLANPGQEDGDRDGPDGIGDACDACPLRNYGNAGRTRADEYTANGELSWSNDKDSDGVADACDNCAPPPADYPPEFPPDELVAQLAAKFGNPQQENCDWRFEVKWFPDHPERHLGDACDPEPCTGVSPTADDWVPASETEARPESEEEVPYPAVPVTVGSLGCAEWGYGTCLRAQPIIVRIPTTGYRPDPNPLQDHAESLPTMVRRCACWDRARNAWLPPWRCNEPDACATDGQFHRTADELEGWMAATFRQRYSLGITASEYRNDGLAQRSFLSPTDEVLEDATDRILFARPSSAAGVVLGPLAPLPEVEWQWERETPPVGYGHPAVSWSLWTRPHIDAPEAGNPLGEDVVLSDGQRAADVEEWALVAKQQEACEAEGIVGGGGGHCDDYANAYLPSAVTVSAPVWDPTGPIIEPGRMGGFPRVIPAGDWYHLFPVDPAWVPLHGPARTLAEWDNASGEVAAIPVLRIVGPDDAAGSDDGRFAVYDPDALTQGLIVDWVGLPVGHATGDGLPSQMADGAFPIDVSEFAILAAPASVVAGGGGSSAGTSTGSGEMEDEPPASRTARLFLFGGVRPDGTYSNRLYSAVIPDFAAAKAVADGQTDGSPVDGPAMLRWSEILVVEDGSSVTGLPVQGEDSAEIGTSSTASGVEDLPADRLRRVPAGIAGATLVPSSDGERLWVVGGRTESGPNNALWAFDLKAGYWEYWGIPAGDSHLLSAMGVAFRGDIAYLYGGWTGEMPTAGLYELNLRTQRMRRLDDGTATGPGARSSASLQLSQDGRSLLFYGGYGSEGWTNDVFRFDVRGSAWERLVTTVGVGEYPPIGPAGILYESWSKRVAIVPTQADMTKQPYWALESGTWKSAARVAGSGLAGDCDGNGTNDPGAGKACMTTASWWGQPGAMVCDSQTGGLVCSAPAAPAYLVDQAGSSRDARVALDSLNTLYEVSKRQLRVYDLADPTHPRQTANVRLAGNGRELLLHNGVLYVATEAGLEAWSRSDRLSPTRLWAITLRLGADDVVASGHTLIAVEPEAIHVYDVRDVAAPTEVATYKLIRVALGVWFVGEAPRWVQDLLRRAVPGRRVAAFDGELLVVADRFDVIGLRLDRTGPIRGVLRSALIPTIATGVRLLGTTAYVAPACGTRGPVLEVLPDRFTSGGAHTLGGWVDQVAFGPGMAARPTERGVEVAHAGI